MNNLPIHLLRVLSLVNETPLDLYTFTHRVVKCQKVPHEKAVDYVEQVVKYGYFRVTSDKYIVRGETPYPEELTSEGHYTFSSECWNCGKIHERTLSIDIRYVWYNCTDCRVRWVQEVM